MMGLSCGRPSDRASFVFPPRSHLASWGTSLKFFQLKLLLNIYSSSSFPSPAGIDADPPTGTKIRWITLKSSSAPSSSGLTNPLSSSSAISHHKHTKHTVLQVQTTGTTSSPNSTTSHTSLSNLPSSPTTCVIPSLSRSTLSIPSLPACQGMSSSRRFLWRTSRVRYVRHGAWPLGRRMKLSQCTPQGPKQIQATPMDYSAVSVAPRGPRARKRSSSRRCRKKNGTCCGSSYERPGWLLPLSALHCPIWTNQHPTKWEPAIRRDRTVLCFRQWPHLPLATIVVLQLGLARTSSEWEQGRCIDYGEQA